MRAITMHGGCVGSELMRAVQVATILCKIHFCDSTLCSAMLSHSLLDGEEVDYEIV